VVNKAELHFFRLAAPGHGHDRQQSDVRSTI
jgi:hypothetical protein